jgi:hypothetical protein
MEEDEILLNRQFCQAANAVAQFYTNSRALHRKAYNDGVKDAIARIEIILRQQKSVNQHVISIDYLLSLISGVGPEIIKEEKGKTMTRSTNEQPLQPKPQHSVPISFPLTNTPQPTQNTFWSTGDNNDQLQSVHQTQVLQAQQPQLPFPLFTETSNNSSTSQNDNFNPTFTFTSEMFNFVSQSPVTSTSTPTRSQQRRRRVQTNHEIIQQPQSHKRNADTYMNDDTFSNGMSLLGLEGVPEPKRSRLHV